MADIKVANALNSFPSKAGRGTINANEKAEDFLTLLKEQIAERKERVEEAIKGGRSLQQQSLGISNEEWARLNLNSSTLTKTDEEKISEGTGLAATASNNSGLSGDSVSSDDTETISRVLGDGTTLVVTTKGNQIISTQKIAPDEISVANPQYISPKDGGVGTAAQKTIEKNVASMNLFG